MGIVLDSLRSMGQPEYNVNRVIATLNIRKRVFRQSEDPFHHLPMYGTVEDPLFLAVDVARILDYSVGHTNDMMRFVSEYDKMRLIANSQTEPENLGNGSKRVGNYKTPKWFITEYGLYEVCMRSSKPVALDFRKSVKDLLHDMRIRGKGGGLEDWLNPDIGDPLTCEWESINQEREDCDEEPLSWEDFLRSKGYTEEMLEDM